MIMITVYEDGDVIAVRKDDGDFDHYILKDGKLTEVPWYEASEYQAPFQKKKDWMKGRKPV